MMEAPRALALASAGVKVRLYEKEKQLIDDPRATTFHPPTMDMLEPFGVAAVMVEQGVQCLDASHVGVVGWRVKGQGDRVQPLVARCLLLDVSNSVRAAQHGDR